MHPPRPSRRRAGAGVFKRLRIGNLVLRRRLWEFSPVPAFDVRDVASDAELFLAVNRWRLDHGLPDRVFVSEKQQVQFDLWPIHKPQFIDFSSPSFLPIFRSVLETSADTLKVEEMLPDPQAFPADEEGRRWAFEAQLESIAFHRILPWKSPIASASSGLPELGSELWRADAHQPSLTAQGGRNV